MLTTFKHLSSRLRIAALGVALAAASSLASAGILHVAIDTAHFGVSSGFLDFQLSASSNVPLATATLSNMVGFDSGAYKESWGVTAVNGGYQFRNDTSNDLFHAVDFGGILSFDLNFAGADDPLTSYVSHFVVAAYDNANGLLGNYNPVSGALADFAWTPALTAIGSGSISATVYDGAITVIPEPADALLTGLGLAAMALVLRRRGRAAPARDDASTLPLAA